jgi:cysteine-rich repeat protein
MNSGSLMTDKKYNDEFNYLTELYFWPVRDGIDTCGNGILNDAEECDDGNNVDGDGCSSSCTNEIVGCRLKVAGPLVYYRGADCAGTRVSIWEVIQEGEEYSTYWPLGPCEQARIMVENLCYYDMGTWGAWED